VRPLFVSVTRRQFDATHCSCSLVLLIEVAVVVHKEANSSQCLACHEGGHGANSSSEHVQLTIESNSYFRLVPTAQPSPTKTLRDVSSSEARSTLHRVTASLSIYEDRSSTISFRSPHSRFNASAWTVANLHATLRARCDTAISYRQLTDAKLFSICSSTTSTPK